MKSGNKLFIVEDDVNVLYSLQNKFSMEEFNVNTDTGNSRIESIVTKIKLFQPDYIILDLLLPRIDGFELMRSIRTDENTNNIPIFVFTNLSDQDSKARCEQLGAEQIFIKDDFSVDAFIEKVMKIIENKNKQKK